jgi:hypothetical protein
VNSRELSLDMSAPSEERGSMVTDGAVSHTLHAARDFCPKQAALDSPTIVFGERLTAVVD